ncbi:hypothetical protein rerp_60040 [Rhodococcus erythropolis]|nr:hypothetical protein rerp_60040 [Rhodococcus erythropolis]
MCGDGGTDRPEQLAGELPGPVGADYENRTVATFFEQNIHGVPVSQVLGDRDLTAAAFVGDSGSGGGEALLPFVILVREVRDQTKGVTEGLWGTEHGGDEMQWQGP